MIKSKPTIQDIRNFVQRIKTSQNFESSKSVLSDMANYLEHLESLYAFIDSVKKSFSSLEDETKKNERKAKQVSDSIESKVKSLQADVRNLEAKIKNLQSSAGRLR